MVQDIMRTVRAAALVIATLLITSIPMHAQAGSVYLNGVSIDGVKNQNFKSCDVRIDAKGNIHITAKGYAVKKGGGPAQNIDLANEGKTPTKRYWIVTKKGTPGMSQYDIDVFINAKWVRKLRGADRQVVFELTKHLKTGNNKVRFIAHKDLSGGRRSSSSQHYFRVILGEGDSGGKNVMLTRKFVDYKRTALETKDFADEFTINVN